MSGVSNPQAIVSIQVTATRINGRGAEVVSLNNPDRTNFSIYLRLADGSAEWFNDFGAEFIGKALIAAAKLSMLYQVPIERMDGLCLDVVRGN